MSAAFSVGYCGATPMTFPNGTTVDSTATDAQRTIWNWFGDCGIFFKASRPATNSVTGNAIGNMLSNDVFERLYYVPCHAGGTAGLLAYRVRADVSTNDTLVNPYAYLALNETMQDKINGLCLVLVDLDLLSHHAVAHPVPEVWMEMPEAEFLARYRDIQQWLPSLQ